MSSSQATMHEPEQFKYHSQVITRRLKEFRYSSPTTVAEAVSLLSEYDGRAKILAGGTDLLSMMKLRAVTPKCVVSLRGIAGLDYIQEEGKELRIGALTRISTILASDIIKRRCLSLHEAAAGFATPQVRNMATIGGNICRGAPSADMPPPLMTFDAELKLVGANGERKVSLEDFFAGAGQNVLDNEILTEITIPLPAQQYGAAFMKLTRNSSDLAMVNCAVRVGVNGDRFGEVRIALGTVADKTIRARKAEQTMTGREITDAISEEAAQKLTEEIHPITEAHAMVYRAQIAKVLIRRVTGQAIKRAR